MAQDGVRPPRGADGKNLPLRLTTRDLPEEGGGATTVLLASKAMRAAHHLASQVAPSDAPVLIMGESGTGKELIARLIHSGSNRAEKPFVPVNCGVLGGELFADKFFGHEAGAFTGAVRLQKGSFELAGDGTLFLDEVGEIPPLNQADFLRVLEQRTFRRLGGDRDLPFGARIVAATNRDLQDMVRRGEFRADLYYRLCVVPVSLPPLRHRREDIPLLAEHFLELFRHRYHSRELTLGRQILAALTDYAWPGNVRELRNLIERLVLVHPGGEIRPADLPPDMRAAAAGSSGLAANARTGLRPAPDWQDPAAHDAPEPRQDRQARNHTPSPWTERREARDAPEQDQTQSRSPWSGDRREPAPRPKSPDHPGGAARQEREAPDAQTAPRQEGGEDSHPLSPRASPHPDEDLTLDAAVRQAEARAILLAFRRARGNRARTAELLDIKPRTLRHKVRELGLVLSLD